MDTQVSIIWIGWQRLPMNNHIDNRSTNFRDPSQLLHVHIASLQWCQERHVLEVQSPKLLLGWVKVCDNLAAMRFTTFQQSKNCSDPDFEPPPSAAPVFSQKIRQYFRCASNKWVPKSRMIYYQFLPINSPLGTNNNIYIITFHFGKAWNSWNHH